jgi:hypothetical protein
LDITFIIDLNDKSPEYLIGLALRVFLACHSQNIHDIDFFVFFHAIDAKDCINFGSQLVHIDMLVKGHQANKYTTINGYIFQYANEGVFN